MSSEREYEMSLRGPIELVDVLLTLIDRESPESVQAIEASRLHDASVRWRSFLADNQHYWRDSEPSSVPEERSA